MGACRVTVQGRQRSDREGRFSDEHDHGRPDGRPGAPRPGESWYAALGERGRKAFRAAFAGYMLDAFDLIVLTLCLSAIGATFDVGTGATGALSTVTLSASALGGILGGLLCDRIGRARTLMLTRRRLLAVHVPLRSRDELRDADGLPRLPGHRLRRGVGRRRGAGGRAGAPGVARQGARGHPERVGRGLGARRRRLPDRVRAVRRADRVARADVPRHPARAADPLHPLARRGPGGLPRGAGRGRRASEVPLKQIFRELLKHDRRVGARDRHPGRLLRDVHLDPDLPEDGARPHGRRHAATCSWSSRARSSAT